MVEKYMSSYSQLSTRAIRGKTRILIILIQYLYSAISIAIQ